MAYTDRDSGGSFAVFRAAVQGILGTLGVFVLIFGIIWVIGMPFAYLGGWQNRAFDMWQQDTWLIFMDRQVFPGGWNLFHASGWFWIIMILATFIGAAMAWMKSEDEGTNTLIPWIATVLALASIVWTVFAFLGSTDKVLAQAMSGEDKLEFVVQDTNNVPESLEALVARSKKNDKDEHCAYVSDESDVPSCITEGDAALNWTPRNTSEASARLRMSKSSVGSSNTYLRMDSLTYLYKDREVTGEDSKKANVVEGSWSAVRDGINRRSLDSVVYWDGKADPKECRFEDDYAIDKAFGGKWDNNLRELIADKYPNLFYELRDVWGFCNDANNTPDTIKDDEPIVVVPMMQQHNRENRTYATMGGALLIRGDHGKAELKLLKNPTTGTDLKAGQLPGPSYPMSLAEKARDLNIWAAGRGDMNQKKFGFETTDEVGSMGDNVSEYMLRDASSGKLYWVTPLKSRRSDSQQFTTWAITEAGAGDAGKLNTTKIYVFPYNDPRAANVSTMHSRVKQEMLHHPEGNAFFSGKGEIIEFLPTSPGHWQAYGELGSQVSYLFDIPVDRSKPVKITGLDPNGLPIDENAVSKPGTKPDAKICNSKLSGLTPAQFQACISELEKEANKPREKAGSKS